MSIATNHTPLSAVFRNFLGDAPVWYKHAILACLIINPIVFSISPYLAGWLLVIEFIFTLAMALKCYPLQPGGILAIEAIAIGMSSPDTVMHEVMSGIEVILLLVFMVAGIYFIKDLLLFVFTKLITKVRSKVAISVAFTASAAILSAFLDALTVVAVIITVALGFYAIYHRAASGKSAADHHDHNDDSGIPQLGLEELEAFRGFLRNLMMHASVGTALGGVMTMVGEPQNIVIATKAGWDFVEFVIRTSPVSFPVFIAGVITTVVLEKTRVFGYGYQLPENVHKILCEHAAAEDSKRTIRDQMKLVMQALVAVWLVIGLAFHLAAVGLIGLTIIIFASAFSGVVDEHSIGKAFEEALPFTSLLVVFFAVVAVINDQGLFTPVIHWVLTYDGKMQMVMFYLANGFLSMVSDNVFVGTVYITQIKAALAEGIINRDQFDLLAVAINTGTNLPSVATPNGQAAFLFLLTSAIAPLLRLSYGTMVYMAFPYTIVLTTVGLVMTYFGLQEMTAYFYEMGWISQQTGLETIDSDAHGHH